MFYTGVIMNPFYNPFFLLKIIKSYLRDINRLNRLTKDQLHRFQDIQTRNIVRYAWKVPVYQQLYKQHGIHPKMIKNRFDLQKLPIVTKDDFTNRSVQDLIPRWKNPSSVIKVSTSGTTGKSLALYVDMYEILLGLFGYLRTIQAYEINWKHHKLAIIGDFAPHTAESGYIKKGLIPKSWFGSAFRNIKWLDTNDSPESILKSLESFQPDFIGGYAGMLGHLAVLKNQGFKSTIQPKIIASTGSILDPKLKKYIEQTFTSKIFEVYGATETGPIGFQPPKKNEYKVMSDFLLLEIQNEQGQMMSSKEPGHLVVTKLYSGGTPIIRYNAINDIVSANYPSAQNENVYPEELYRIYGRDSIRLYRKDGKIILGSTIATIFSRLLYKLETSKIRDIKVIQESLNKIVVNFVVDKNLRTKGVHINEICKELAQGFKETFGETIIVQFNEVDTVNRDEPRILTKVNPESIKITGFA